MRLPTDYSSTYFLNDTPRGLDFAAQVVESISQNNYESQPFFS